MNSILLWGLNVTPNFATVYSIKSATSIKNVAELNQLEKFIYLFTLEDNQALTWLGKFIY